MNATELYFPVLLFVLLSNLVRRLASLGEVLIFIQQILGLQSRDKAGGHSRSQNNKALLHDVTAAILVFQNNETATMLLFRTNPVGVELFSYLSLIHI